MLLFGLSRAQRKNPAFEHWTSRLYYSFEPVKKCGPTAIAAGFDIVDANKIPPRLEPAAQKLGVCSLSNRLFVESLAFRLLQDL